MIKFFFKWGFIPYLLLILTSIYFLGGFDLENSLKSFLLILLESVFSSTFLLLSIISTVTLLGILRSSEGRKKIWNKPHEFSSYFPNLDEIIPQKKDSSLSIAWSRLLISGLRVFLVIFSFIFMLLSIGLSIAFLIVSFWLIITIGSLILQDLQIQSKSLGSINIPIINVVVVILLLLFLFTGFLDIKQKNPMPVSIFILIGLYFGSSLLYKKMMKYSINDVEIYCKSIGSLVLFGIAYLMSELDWIKRKLKQEPKAIISS